MNMIRQVIRELSMHSNDPDNFQLDEILVKTRHQIVVQKTIRKMIESGQGLITVPGVTSALKDRENIHLTKSKVRRVMVNDMGLVYRKSAACSPM